MVSLSWDGPDEGPYRVDLRLGGFENWIPLDLGWTGTRYEYELTRPTPDSKVIEYQVSGTMTDLEIKVIWETGAGETKERTTSFRVALVKDDEAAP